MTIVPDVLAGGAVLWRPSPDGVEVAVVHRPRYDDWTLPKGKLERGEHLTRCAVREVEEETGHRAVLGRCLGDLDYVQASGVHKRVRYWAAGSSTGRFTANREIDEVRWLPVAAAQTLLSYPRDLVPLDRFCDGPPDTTTLVLLRHGSAGSRATWRGDDASRPLDELGRAQALAGVDVLHCYGVDRVVSADVARCVETVRPMADALGVAVDYDPVLSEDAYPSHAADAVDHLRETAVAGRHTVLCSQGGVIPDLIMRLAEIDKVPLPRSIPSRKGSAWVLSFDGSTCIDAHYESRLTPADVADG
ncbi:MAG TPA: NUDIX hydrolase [Mycobacteriales bacterium]|nr:NUDIX hydrolase [Mycobacteriales bacterium]